MKLASHAPEFHVPTHEQRLILGDTDKLAYGSGDAFDCIDALRPFSRRFLTSGRLGQPSSMCLEISLVFKRVIEKTRQVHVGTHLRKVSFRAKALKHSGHWYLRSFKCTYSSSARSLCQKLWVCYSHFVRVAGDQFVVQIVFCTRNVGTRAAGHDAGRASPCAP